MSLSVLHLFQRAARADNAGQRARNINEQQEQQEREQLKADLEARGERLEALRCATEAHVALKQQHAVIIMRARADRDSEGTQRAVEINHSMRRTAL